MLREGLDHQTLKQVEKRLLLLLEGGSSILLCKRLVRQIVCKDVSKQGVRVGSKMIDSNSIPPPLDMRSAVTVNQALSRAEPSLETVIAKQELPEGTGADFVPAPEGQQLG